MSSCVLSTTEHTALLVLSAGVKGIEDVGQEQGSLLTNILLSRWDWLYNFACEGMSTLSQLRAAEIIVAILFLVLSLGVGYSCLPRELTN